jgi:tRNA1(Val) A37 N6-methylase TrmN6
MNMHCLCGTSTPPAKKRKMAPSLALIPSRPLPELESRLADLTRELGEELTLDSVTRDFRIFQRRRGHRHSTDDLLTAWYAVTKMHEEGLGPRRLLDLGTGIGSVGLALAWAFPDSDLTAIEVQPGSFRLLRENVWANGVEARARPHLGDLRRLRDVIGDGVFDLVTGSPPYFDVRSGIVSADPQRAGARFELNGDVGDYCRSARGALAPRGRFVFCFPTLQYARAVAAVEQAALTLMASRDVVPKEGLAPLFSLFVCRLAEAAEPRGATTREAPLVVRDAGGVHTADMTAARAVFGMSAQPR